MTNRKKMSATDDATGTEGAAPELDPTAEPEYEPAAGEDVTIDTALAASEQAADVNGDLAVDEDEDDLDSEDSLTFSNGVIEKIVAIAVRDVPGVLGMKGGFVSRVQETFGATLPTKGVTVEVMPDNSVRVNIAVLIEYGAYAPQVFEDVKKAVVKHVTGMTGLEVGGVNLRIEDVLTAEEFRGAKAAAKRAEAEAAQANVATDGE